MREATALARIMSINLYFSPRKKSFIVLISYSLVGLEKGLVVFY